MVDYQKRRRYTPPRHPPEWSYGITTVPERIGTTLPITINSLREAGFDHPILFIDGSERDWKWEGDRQLQDTHVHEDLPRVFREQNLGTCANWLLAATELYLREPHAKRFAIFQDDFVTYRNLRLYLERVTYPANSFLNLYTFPRNQRIGFSVLGNRAGFFESDQHGMGAVALVFDNPTVRVLLKQQHIIDRFQGDRRYIRIDGGIMESMRKAGIKEFCHNPSLVQHIGHKTSMGSPASPDAPVFLGEEFDALKFLEGDWRW